MKFMRLHRSVLGMMCILFSGAYPMQSTNQEYLRLKKKDAELQRRYDEMTMERTKTLDNIARQWREVQEKDKGIQKRRPAAEQKIDGELDEAYKALASLWPDMQKEIESEAFKRQFNSCSIYTEKQQESECEAAISFYENIVLRTALETKNDAIITYVKNYENMYVLPALIKQTETSPRVKYYSKEEIEEDAKEALALALDIQRIAYEDSNNKQLGTAINRFLHEKYASLKNKIIELNHKRHLLGKKEKTERDQLWDPFEKKIEERRSKIEEKTDQLSIVLEKEITEIRKALVPFWSEIKNDLESFKQQLKTCDNSCSSVLTFWITALVVASMTRDSNAINYIKQYTSSYILPIEVKRKFGPEGYPDPKKSAREHFDFLLDLLSHGTALMSYKNPVGFYADSRGNFYKE